MFNPSQLADMANTVIAELENVMNLSGGIVPSDTRLLIQNALQDAEQAISAFRDSDNAAAARSLADRIGADLGAVLNVVATLPLPQPAVLPVRIASLLVPILTSVADMIWPPVHASSAAMVLLRATT